MGSKQLNKNEVNFQILSDQSNDAIVILNGTEVVYCNPTFEELIKYSHNKIIGQNILNFIIDLDHTDFEKYLEKHLRENKTIPPYKTKLISKDNKKINIKIKPSLISYHSQEAPLLVIHKISEHKQTERKILHLNTILRSIRNVNQLITREKNPIRLIQGSCDTLVNSGGYTAAWIALCNKDKKYNHFVESGIGKSFNSFCKNFSETNLPDFVQYALKHNNPVFNSKRENICCADYSLLKNTSDQCVLLYRLKYKNQFYGILAVHVSNEYIDMYEERELLQEIGDDISFALYGIELEEELKQRREHFRSIYENSTIGMYRTTPKGEII
ncbi:MAG: PAS domain S-box protein, partial [bacterium]